MHRMDILGLRLMRAYKGTLWRNSMVRSKAGAPHLQKTCRLENSKTTLEYLSKTLDFHSELLVAKSPQLSSSILSSICLANCRLSEDL
jgi:hypothetical protein